MSIKLSGYQKKLLKRLVDGGILSRSHLGPYTGAYHFKGTREGINGAAIDKLRKEGLVKVTDKMTMYGLQSYVHIPEMNPWTKDESYIAYMRRH